MAHINEMARSRSSRLLAAVWTETSEADPKTPPPGWVSVYSLSQRALLGEFSTTWEVGGVRLAVLEDPELVFAGAYARHGVAAYEMPSGKEVWRRKGLKRVQVIREVCLEGKPLLSVGRNNGALTFLNPSTGATVAEVQGYNEAWPAGNNAVLAANDHQFAYLEGSRLRERWAKRLSSFAVLDVACCHDQVLVSEAGGPARAFSLHGDFLWRVQLEEHFVEVLDREAVGGWLARQYDGHLYSISPEGRLEACGRTSPGAVLLRGEVAAAAQPQGIVQELVSQDSWRFVEPDSYSPWSAS